MLFRSVRSEPSAVCSASSIIPGSRYYCCPVGLLTRLRPFKHVSLDELHPDTEKATCIQRERNAEFLRNRYGSERYHAVALNDRYLIFSTNAYGRRSACFALEAHHMGLRDWLAFIAYTVLHHPESRCGAAHYGRGAKTVTAADPHSATVPAEQVSYRGKGNRGSRIAFRCRVPDGLIRFRGGLSAQGRVEFRACDTSRGGKFVPAGLGRAAGGHPPRCLGGQVQIFNRCHIAARRDTARQSEVSRYRRCSRHQQYDAAEAGRLRIALGRPL